MKNMMIQIASRHLCRLAVAGLLCLTLPLAAQQRTGGGGGGGGGGGFGGGGGGGAAGGRTGGSSSSSGTSDLNRPGNGQIATPQFYVDQDSRTLYVIGDDNTTTAVSNVVTSLSRPKPQVLIKVVFLEVTYNKGVDVGIEGSVTKNINASTTNTVSSLFGLASQGITPNSAGVNTLPGAGIYSVVGNDFTATLRAISEVGKIEILSRPTILARNNQMAQIVVGEQVPLITSVTYDTFGNEHNGISYQNVGIILQVTPFISDDGMVEMILAPQISNVDPTHSQAIAYATNGAAITAPYIDIDSANTVVVTPDGQTVVIGGLMQNSKTSTDSKIPILGDIPGLGLLFHHKLTSNVKTELIFLLTPFVVRTPADLVRMSQDERSRAEMAPKAFPQKTLNQYLDSGQDQPVPGAAPPPTRNPRSP
jgi:type II secretory pathway component GspD/PulD (secretin)